MILALAIAIPLAACVVFGIGVFIGHDHGYQRGHSDGYKTGWAQCKFDAAMDAANPDEERAAYEALRSPEDRP